MAVVHLKNVFWLWLFDAKLSNWRLPLWISQITVNSGGYLYALFGSCDGGAVSQNTKNTARGKWYI